MHAAAVHGQANASLVAGYGFTGILVSFLARHNPLAVVPVAILFILFDVELVFLYPWAVVYRTLGTLGLVEMGVFLGILMVGYVYAWDIGALDWE